MNKQYRNLSLLLCLSLGSTSHANSGNIFTTHDNETLTNTGFISVDAEGDTGMGSAYAGATLINAASGLISTTGVSSGGMVTNDVNSYIINNGNLTGTACGAFGIIAFGSNTNIENNGTIVSSGPDGGAISTLGSYITANNAGTITVSGGGSTAVLITGAYDAFINTGAVTNTDEQVTTVLMSNNYQTLNNSGLLTSGGVDSITINANGSYAVIINSGSIISSGSGTNSYALYQLEGTNSLVRLDSGSVIVGAIYSGDVSNTLMFNLGAGKSYRYSFAGVGTVTDANQRPVTLTTTQVTSAGLGAQQQASHGQVYRALHVGNTVQRRLYNKSQADFVGVARTPSSRLISKTSFAGAQFAQNIWVEPYVSYSQRGTDASEPSVAPYHLSEAGLTLGTTFNDYLKGAEAIINIDNSQLNVDGGNQHLDTRRLMAGLVSEEHTNAKGMAWFAKGLLSYARHHGNRVVYNNDDSNGSEIVSAHYASEGFLVGLEARKPWRTTATTQLHWFAGIDLATEHFDAYSESNYFAWNARTLIQSIVHLDAQLEHRAKNHEEWIRLGLAQYQTLYGHRFNFAIDNAPDSFSDTTGNDVAVRGELGARCHLRDKVEAYLTLGGSKSRHHVTDYDGHLGVSVNL
ncbi:MAG: autotransporter outer membrane beta-barrel domain-containing protein [Pseudomonadota bacterium]